MPGAAGAARLSGDRAGGQGRLRLRLRRGHRPGRRLRVQVHPGQPAPAPAGPPRGGGLHAGAGRPPPGAAADRLPAGAPPVDPGDAARPGAQPGGGLAARGAALAKAGRAHRRPARRYPAYPEARVRTRRQAHRAWRYQALQPGLRRPRRDHRVDRLGLLGVRPARRQPAVRGGQRHGADVGQPAADQRPPGRRLLHRRGAAQWRALLATLRRAGGRRHPLRAGLGPVLPLRAPGDSRHLPGPAGGVRAHAGWHARPGSAAAHASRRSLHPRDAEDCPHRDDRPARARRGAAGAGVGASRRARDRYRGVQLAQGLPARGGSTGDPERRQRRPARSLLQELHAGHGRDREGLPRRGESPGALSGGRGVGGALGERRRLHRHLPEPPRPRTQGRLPLGGQQHGPPGPGDLSPGDLQELPVQCPGYPSPGARQPGRALRAGARHAPSLRGQRGAGAGGSHPPAQLLRGRARSRGVPGAARGDHHRPGGAQRDPPHRHDHLRGAAPAPQDP